MWSKISGALKPREGNDSDSDADPFHTNAATYYHQAPPTPPYGHARTASREEDIIWSLRTQLALQQELCAQFQIDLSARDELVEALTLRLDAVEKENDRRKGVIRSWKKKAADLEKLCRHLEGEADNSRQDCMERSIMDEASGEALCQLHQQISHLEREKNGVVAERDSLAQTMKHLIEEIAQLKDECVRLGDVEKERDNASSEISQLRVQVQQLQKDSAIKEMTIVQLYKQLDQNKEDVAGLNIALESKQQELELVKRKHGARSTVGPTPARTNVPPNHRPPVSGTLRRASSSNLEFKTKPRRASITFKPEEKENEVTLVPLKPPRRTMVPA